MRDEDRKRIEAALAEAEQYNRDMEERGFHYGGLEDIDGVYDPRIHALTCAIHALLEEVDTLRSIAAQHHPSDRPRDDASPSDDEIADFGRPGPITRDPLTEAWTTGRMKRSEASPRVALTTDPSDPRLRVPRPDGRDQAYLVLSEEERSKGFVRPVRRSYTHVGRDGGERGCGAVTTMGTALAETYARNPTFYNATFCAICCQHFPVGARGEFVWEGTSERVGT